MVTRGRPNLSKEWWVSVLDMRMPHQSYRRCSSDFQATALWVLKYNGAVT